MSYTVITEHDIINLFVKKIDSWQTFGLISPSNIASLLKTSRYQVNKHIISLKQKNLIEYGWVMLNDELPPYNGYRLTEKGYETNLKSQ